MIEISALLLLAGVASPLAPTPSAAPEKPTAETTMLVDCEYALACTAAKWFVPRLQANNQAKIVIRVPNLEGKSLNITEPWSSLTGTATGCAVKLRPTPVQGNGLYVDVPITIDDGPRPDDYKGSVVIDTGDSKARSIIPVNVQVRTSPIPVIVIIFISLGLGALAQFVDAKIKPQYALATRLDRLANALDSGDLALLQPAVDEAMQASDRGDAEEAAVLAAAVTSHAHILRAVRGIENALDLNSPGAAAIQKAIARVRADIRYGLEPSGDMLTLTTAVGDNAPGAITSELHDSVAAHLNTLASLHAQKTQLGVARARADVRRSAFATALSFAKAIVVIVLAWTGFYLLWVKNPSFGGSCFVDYASAAIWGLGTKAVLSSIPTIQTFLTR